MFDQKVIINLGVDGMRRSEQRSKSISRELRTVWWLVLLMAASAMITGMMNLENNHTALAASAVSFTKTGGWLESAYAEWTPVTDATGYNVYCKLATAPDDQYVKVDALLVREYPLHFRVDVLGLAAGDYVIKVVPTKEGTEISSAAAVTPSLNVKAHTREGFAFSPLSPMKTGSGGYNDDGTVPENAQIVYITPETANTVTLDVITDSKGKTTTCTGLVNILAARQKGYDKTPLIFRMIGQVKDSHITGLNSSGYIQLKGCYNVTFEGVGEDATAYGWGILIRDAHNVEVRNLGMMLFPDDGVSLDTGNENIWVHNVDFFYGKPGSDSDQVKGDGSLDVKKSNFVTFSYNHFWDSGKASLCGLGESSEFFVTYHHNWFDHSDSRHPRIRTGTIHIYNNYYDGVSKYGVGNTTGGSAFVEANYFRNCKYPMLISKQGTDIYYDSKGTFSGEPGGMIKAYNNIVVGATRLIYHTQDPVHFDAYLATTRNEQVPTTYKTVSGGNTYNNFDTASTMYTYTPDAPEDVPAIVTKYAGRVNGGDFKWTFTDADDASYDVNTALKQKILNYNPASVKVAPAAPTNLTATSGNKKVTLQWTGTSDASSYNVKRAESNGGPYITVKSVTLTSYTDTEVENGKTYYYVVTAVNYAGESANSNQVIATPQAPSAPAAPSNLKATVGNTKVYLSWDASPGANGYKVMRSTTSGGPYDTIQSGLTTTGYLDTGVTNGTTYYYVVTAVNDGGESPKSSEVAATPYLAPPPAPTNLTATADHEQVTLSWSESLDAVSYNVKRATSPGGPYMEIQTGLTGLSYTDTGLKNGTTYYYVVSAVNAAGESGDSAEISATPVFKLISNLVVLDTENKADWSIQSDLQVGKEFYGDRTYQILTLPDTYRGCDWIKTANDSKSATHNPLVTFKVNAAATVYVAFDDRVTSKPSWFTSGGWSDTNDDITSHDGTRTLTYSIFAKDFKAGDTVTLGANGTSSGVCGYFVIVKSLAPSLPNLSINDVEVTEGDSGLTEAVFTVTLSKAVDEPVTVDYTTRDGTATVADNDYVAVSGSLTFASGETSKTVTVTVYGDTQKELDETFYVILSNVSENALIAKEQGICIIVDDDRQPVATPIFSAPGGDYNNALAVTIHCATAEAQIRYTTDGTEPDEQSALYDGKPIIIEKDMTLKAKAFQEWWKPSDTASANYRILSTTLISRPDANQGENAPGHLKTAQGFRNDLSIKYNSATLLLAKGNSGQISDIWLYYPNIIGSGAGQIPENAKIAQAKLVLTVKEITGNRFAPRGFKLYTITDPDNYGAPCFGIDGVRNGLDFRYRDHRPGMDRPWKKDASDITGLLEGSLPVDSFEFVPALFELAGENQIQLDVTASVKAWLSGKPNQGWFLTIDNPNAWYLGDGIEFYGLAEADPAKRPVLKVTYLTEGDTASPEPVRELSALPDSNRVVLAWTNPSGNAGVRVLRKAGSVPFDPWDGILVYDGPATNVTDDGLINGTIYYYSVFAYDSSRNYSNKVWASAVPADATAAVPSAPTGLTVIVGGSNLEFSWNKVAGAEWYELEQREKDAEWAVVANPAGDQTQYSTTFSAANLGLKPNTEYQYRIKAVNVYGASNYSASFTLSTPDFPMAPAGLTWKIISAGRVNLSWVDQADNESSYRIDVLNAEDHQVLWSLNIAADSTEYSVTGLVPEQSYIIKVVAVNGIGETAVWTEAITTTADPKGLF